MKDIVEILGVFGDKKLYSKEETFPIIKILHPEFSYKYIDEHTRKYFEYGFLRKSLNGKIEGHPNFQITRRGEEALDYYRNMHNKSLDEDPDKLKNSKFSGGF
jgi:hypothetical protein